MTTKSSRHRLVELGLLLALILVILGKLLFGDPDTTLFLLAYGILVTTVTWMTLIFAFVFYQDPYEQAIKKKVKNLHPYLVSCMVAVRNEEENISRCLDSILRQTYLKTELIVVNDASTDHTAEILKEYATQHPIRLINLEQNGGKKRALGRAMAIAKGKIFAHTDSDSVWAPDAIEKIVRIFATNPNVGAVSGHGRALNGDKNFLTKVQGAWMEGQFSARKAFESVFGAVTCVSGPLAVFRKEAIFNYIPAWENDRFLGQEFKFATDRTLTGVVLGCKTIGKRLKAKYKDTAFVKSVDYPVRDWQVVYCKAAKSWTIVPDTFRRLLKQQIRWKKSFIRNMFFTGTFYWRKPLPVSLAYYLHVIFVLMGPFVSFRHLVYLPLRGDIFSGILYLAGIVFIGFTFGLAYKLEDKSSHRWIYRPAMSLLSTLVISWLIFYSALTIKKMVWSRS